MKYSFVLILNDEEWASTSSAEECARTYRYNVQDDKTLCDRLTLEVYKNCDSPEPVLKLTVEETYAFLFGKRKETN